MQESRVRVPYVAFAVDGRGSKESRKVGTLACSKECAAGVGTNTSNGVAWQPTDRNGNSDDGPLDAGDETGYISF